MKNFIKTTLFGGFVVLLPVAILVMFFKWLFTLISEIIQPVTRYIADKSLIPIPDFWADTISVILILISCFVVGLIVATQAGKWIHNLFDGILQKIAPGYRMIKEVVIQIFGNKEDSPFSNGVVGKAKIFGDNCPTEVTVLITDHDKENKIYSLFMPTGPNPTSGNIYHVPEALVTLYPDVKIDSAMRTVIACGAGSAELFR